MFRIIIILVCGVVLWEGFDRVGVAMFNNDLQTFAIGDVESNGVGDARYIEVTSAMPEGTMVYTTDQDTGQVIDVVFPVSTFEKVILASEEEPIQATLYIVRDPNNMGEQSCTFDNDFCIEFEEKSYTGIVQVGLNDMDDETRDLFVSNGIPISDDVIVLDENAKPTPLLKSFGLMGAALLVLLISLWSFTWGKGDEAEA